MLGHHHMLLPRRLLRLMPVLEPTGTNAQLHSLTEMTHDDALEEMEGEGLSDDLLLWPAALRSEQRTTPRPTCASWTRSPPAERGRYRLSPAFLSPVGSTEAACANPAGGLCRHAVQPCGIQPPSTKLVF